MIDSVMAAFRAVSDLGAAWLLSKVVLVLDCKRRAADSDSNKRVFIAEIGSRNVWRQSWLRQSRFVVNQSDSSQSIKHASATAYVQTAMSDYKGQRRPMHCKSHWNKSRPSVHRF